MAFVKAGLATLVLLGGTLAAADCALAQTEASAGTAQAGAPVRKRMKGVQAQAPTQAQPQAKSPAAAPPPAAAQPKAPAAATPAPAVKQNTRGPEQEYAECLNMWDAATHMTRAEWAATCRRIQNRLNDITMQAKDLNSPGRRRAR